MKIQIRKAKPSLPTHPLPVAKDISARAAPRHAIPMDPAIASPGKPAKGDLILSVTAINELLNCPQKWGWKYRKRLQPRGLQTPLFLGTLVHFVLDQVYRGENFKAATRNLETFYSRTLREFGHMSPEDRAECDMQFAIASGMAEGYTSVYPTAEDFEVLASEYQFLLPVCPIMQDCTNPRTLWFVGVIDLIVMHRGSLWVVEHKTSSRIDKNYLDRLEMDYQISGMLWALRKLVDMGIIRNADGTRPTVKGVVYNVIRKPGIRRRKDEQRDQFVKRLASLYTEQAPEYFHRQEFFRSEAKNQEFEAMLRRTAGVQMFYDSFTPEELPRNTFACTAKGTCEFLPLCTRGPDRLTMMLYQNREVHQLPNCNQPLALE